MERTRSCGRLVVDTLSNNQHQPRKQQGKAKYQLWKKGKYFLFSVLIMTEDSSTLSLDLANDFPGTEKRQIRHKEPTSKMCRQRTGSPITK